MLEVFIRGGFERRRRHKTLSPRQREVLRLLAEGKTMKEAAAVLNLRRRTIRFHKYRIMQQLGIDSRRRWPAVMRINRDPGEADDAPLKRSGTRP
jgi:DNA-binding NarL/FixJ family response regulator